MQASGEDSASEALKRVRDMIGEVTATLDGAVKAHKPGTVLGGDGGGSHREKEVLEELAALKEEMAVAEGKYNKLLDEKISDVDEFTKTRLLKTEELNRTLLKKAKEDSKLLEARELEIQVRVKGCVCVFWCRWEGGHCNVVRADGRAEGLRGCGLIPRHSVMTTVPAS